MLDSLTWKLIVKGSGNFVNFGQRRSFTGEPDVSGIITSRQTFFDKYKFFCNNSGYILTGLQFFRFTATLALQVFFAFMFREHTFSHSRLQKNSCFIGMHLKNYTK